MKIKLTKIIALIAALVLCVSAFASCSGKDDSVTGADKQIENDENQNNQSGSKTAASGKNPITGESGYDTKYAGARPVAIMVENTPSARPQWGLCSPDMIIETEVEGGITRMMWIYANEDRVPDKVGPVRSARNAYVELACGLDAVFFHIGASNLAYDLLKDGLVDDIDGMSVDFFSRDKSRNVALEHTAYTTKSDVKAAISSRIDDMTISQSAKDPFTFVATGATASGTACSSIKTVFSQDYRHTFEYNANDGLYYNWMNTKEMTDENGEQMAVKNVLVLYASMVDLGDEKGHVDVSLSTGNGYYASEGKIIPITWTKNGAQNKLTFTDANGNAVSLNAGKTWIGFVRSTNSSSTVIS